MKVYIDDQIERIGTEELQPLFAQLPDWRQEKAMRFKHLAGQRECAMAYLLLAQALREEYGITHTLAPFTYTEHGKPLLSEHPDIHFSLSHCRHAVLCIVHDSPVGADIEGPRSIRPELLRYTMNEEEQADILSSPHPEMSFSRLWTRKEAVVKLTGEGIGSHMHDILLPSHLAQAGIAVETYTKGNLAYSIATYL